jgi:uncharacterized protein YecE (DUF72 family)
MQRLLFAVDHTELKATPPARRSRGQSSGAQAESVEQQAHRAQLYAQPLPKFVGNIRLGTAGWTDPTLLSSGHFYPPDAHSPELRLRHYAKHFSMVEVDSSYYALPTVPMTTAWLDRTPDDFVFDVKAFSLLTGHPVVPARLPLALRKELRHQTRASVAAADVPESVVQECFTLFLKAIDPLRQRARLGSVLLQFPPWFDATRKNAKYVELVRERLASVPVSIELRHASWGELPRFGRVCDWLRELRAAYVCVDEPQGHRNSMPSHIAVTDSRMAVVRFHGRRKNVWDKPVSVQEKYRYWYRPEELRPWASKLATLSAHADVVHAVFNNCSSDYAVIGAKDMTSELLDSLGSHTERAVG